MMAFSASIPMFCHYSTNYWRLYPAKKLKGSINFLMGKQSYISTTRLKPSFPIRSLGEEKEQTPLVESNGPLMLQQEDLNYVSKLGAGSIVGAAMIKYGSVLFPDITRPNILQALIMISAPVIISVFLLIKQTFDDSSNEQRC